ncbi:MAG: MliC family protein [Pseudomonadota bacterium]
MTFKTLLCAGAACLTFASAASANVEYNCGQFNNATYSITYFDEEDIAEIRAVDLAGQMASALMRPAPSGSGSRYVSDTGNSEFIEHQGNASLFVLGNQLSCFVTAVTEPGVGADNDATLPPWAGRSFGGNLRAGPGTQFADVGSTFNGQPITILQNTGVFMNGYTWFVVQLQNGQQAHQWGGILCAPGQFLQGAFNEGC